MLDWFLNDFAMGTMKASDFQSIAQLTVAVSLAYVVAGPDVRRLLRSNISAFTNLDSTLNSLKSEGAQVPDIQQRQILLSSAARFIEADATKVAPANASTTWFYAISAIVSFIFLVYCTFCTDLYRSVAALGTAAAVVVTTRDAFQAARRASNLQVLAGEIHRIARSYDVSMSPENSLSKFKNAAGIVAKLERQSIDLREANRQLKAI